MSAIDLFCTNFTALLGQYCYDLRPIIALYGPPGQLVRGYYPQAIIQKQQLLEILHQWEYILQ